MISISRLHKPLLKTYLINEKMEKVIERLMTWKKIKSAILVTKMDLYVVVVMLCYGAIIEGKEFLQTGRGDAISIPDDPSEDGKSQVLALLILESNGDTELNEVHSHKKTKWPSLTDGLSPEQMYTDSSGDSNSDEYADSATSADTDSESNYYHEEDYKDDISNRIEISDLIQDRTVMLRKRWRSCQKKAAKVCRQACSASYKNACDMTKCKSKLKRNMKKECKRNCKDYFM